MGLFSFFKGKGKKLGSAAAAEAPSADDLKTELKELGLDEGLDVTIDGDKVKINGTPKDQATKEKAIVAMGNIEGIASVEDETPGDEPTFYTVVSGDTLSGIAKKTLGNANAYMKIFDANKPMLSNPDKIYPDQVLRIPQD
ncbi:peptidoglycan-binding protein LysM [Pseudoruegeria sp. SK021]|uniref:peptidoglycan-binding protein LysM n=1 Tax=Pseudoruegeria sp. SK021 TaxID=1933035 RepID=UPI000A257EA1|nr:peptidoglycan-binding protein LysM [Pseudoruegeria sp. SK021]OSP55675.1 peptidoglycan-binding protein LysM [Pseudoruegeria sp. SK021]